MADLADLGPAERDARVAALCDRHAGLAPRIRGIAGALGRLGSGLAPGLEPEWIGPYRVLENLGEGGMGAVYLCEQDEPVRMRVAVKLVKNGMATMATPAAFERFRREGRLAAGIDHPRCVFVYAADKWRGEPYLAMELLPGPDLQRYHAANAPLSVDAVVGFALDILDGVEAAHRVGVIHRDLKPSNIILDHFGRAKVGDFGLSRTLHMSSELTGGFVGTPMFAAPEQLEEKSADTLSDVYAAAGTFYYLLAGRPPFHATSSAGLVASVLEGEPTGLRVHRPDVPTTVEAVIMRGLARDPAHRWHSARAFRDALASVARPSYEPAVPALRVLAGVMDATLFWAFVGLLVAVGSAPTPLAILVMAYAFLALPTASLARETIAMRLLGLRTVDADMRHRAKEGQQALRLVVPAVMLSLPGVLIASDPMWTLVAAGVVVSVVLLAVRRGSLFVWDMVSATRVVVPKRAAASLHPRRVAHDAPQPAPDLPARLGPYTVQGLLSRQEGHALASAFDAELGRRVWLEWGPGDRHPLSQTRRGMARQTRLRWIISGSDGTAVWNAYAEPHGETFLQFAASQPTWETVRRFLLELARELEQGQREGELPPRLALELLRVREDGTPLLVDVGPLACSASEEETGVTCEARSLRFLATVARALQSSRRPGEQAPLPLHAASLMARIAALETPGQPVPHISLATLVDELEAVQTRPSRTTSGMRAVGAAALGGMVLLLVLTVMVVGAQSSAYNSSINSLGRIMVFGSVRWIVLGTWALPAGLEVAWRESLGLAVVDASGVSVPVWTRIARFAIVWGPLLLAIVVAAAGRGLVGLAGLCVAIAVAMFWIRETIRRPGRSLVDRLTRSYVVPT